MQQATDTEDVFALDVQIVTETSPAVGGGAGRACTTNDGCDPTCASSCVSIA